MLVEELSRSAHAIRSRAVLRMNATDRDVVSAVVDVGAGSPTRARQRRRFEIPVRSSLRLVPDVLLIEDLAVLEQGRFGEVTLELADGWSIDRIDAPDWIRYEIESGGAGLALYARRIPDMSRRVEKLVLFGSDDHGNSTSRTLRCVIDQSE